MKIFIHCPVLLGGIAEHTHYQAKSLASAGQEIILLTGKGFLDGRRLGYNREEVFHSPVSFFSLIVGRLGDLCDKCLKIVGDEWHLAWEIIVRKPDMVLLASYNEYLSPLWFLPHWIGARFFGVVYVANLHDPVRDYVVGPKWWHDLSVKLAYLPISIGVVHQRLPRPSPVPKHVRVVEAPVGVYDLQEIRADPHAIRKGWAGEGKVVFLAFGFIRDNKNLDLVIRALPSNPEAMLVVMGKAQSQKDKPLEFYRSLSSELGVSERVRFFDEFVPDEKLASYFAAADVVVLTYDKTFHSQSGVLNVAARARRPVLASSGESPLKDCVQKFKLGVFVEPDDLDALKRGMACLINAKCGMQNGKCGEPDWEGYEAFASWDVNVAKILEAVEELKDR